MAHPLLSRCAMNAFLAVKVNRLPVNTLEEIEDEKMTILMWGNDGLEHYLSSFETYKKAKEENRIQYVQSTGIVFKHLLCSESVRNVLNSEQATLELLSRSDSVLFEYEISMQAMDRNFPCQLKKV